MSVVDVTKIGISMLNIIEHVHSIGITHQDIKPDNILMADTESLSGCDDYPLDLSELTKESKVWSS
jgi:serine/threonine protein kinase